jgi:hypothetical protein
MLMNAIIKHRKRCLAQHSFKRSGKIVLKQMDRQLA